MKHTNCPIITAALGLACASFAAAQDNSLPAAKPESTPKAEAASDPNAFKHPDSFNRLSEEKKQSFRLSVARAQQMMAKKQVQEAMHNLYEAELIVPDHMVVHSLMGNGFVHMRDFNEARKAYGTAQKLFPTFSTEFNLAEVEFVEGQFESAERMFTKLLKTKGLSPDQKKLITYKRVICLIELDRRQEAEIALKEFSPMDEYSPIYFFSNAAICFHDNEFDAAFGWVDDARVSYHPNTVAVYIDSITEVYARKDASGRLKSSGNDDGGDGGKGGDDNSGGTVKPVAK